MKMYAVLMAGGVGTRFWPRSRSRQPKQVLNIFDHQTLIQNTYQRLEGLVAPDRIFVVTNVVQKDLIAEQIPELKDENFILEPYGRNTAPCIGLAAVNLQQMEPDSVMVVLPADHLIQNVAEFQKVITYAANFVAEQDGLVTLGIHPDKPATGYGYIQRGEKVASFNDHDIYKVKTFAEKPNYDTAVRFLESGDFYWNSGMFIWKTSTILKEIEEKLPELSEGLEEIRKTIGTPEYEAKVENVYRRIRGISIDYGVMQTARQVFVIPTDMGWSDVGSWEEVYNIAPKDENKNAGDYHHLVQIASRENYVYAPGKVVALVGVRGIVVVDTGDALLVSKKSRTQEVKDVVEILKKNGLDEYI